MQSEIFAHYQFQLFHLNKYTVFILLNAHTLLNAPHYFDYQNQSSFPSLTMKFDLRHMNSADMNLGEIAHFRSETRESEPKLIMCTPTYL